MTQAISKREAIVQALVKAIAVFEDADTKVYRNLDKPHRIPAGGMIIVRDNEAEKETDVLLNPLTYTYELVVQLEIMVQHQDSDTRSRMLDLLISMAGGVIELNRTLAGLAEYVETKPAEFQDDQVDGAPTIRSAIMSVIVRFSET